MPWKLIDLGRRGVSLVSAVSRGPDHIRCIVYCERLVRRDGFSRGCEEEVLAYWSSLLITL